MLVELYFGGTMGLIGYLVFTFSVAAMGFAQFKFELEDFGSDANEPSEAFFLGFIGALAFMGGVFYWMSLRL